MIVVVDVRMVIMSLISNVEDVFYLVKIVAQMKPVQN